MWADAQHDGRPAEYRWRPLRKFRNSIPCTMPQSLADAGCGGFGGARMPCSNAANMRERKTWTQSEFCSCQKCIYSVAAQKTAKHRAKFRWPPLRDIGAVTKQNPFAGVAQSHQLIAAISEPKFTILWGLVGEILLLNKFFPVVDICLICEDIARQSCAMVPRWEFLATYLGPAFSASRAQHVSDLHSKFALRPHHVWKYGRHQMCGR